MMIASSQSDRIASSARPQSYRRVRGVFLSFPTIVALVSFNVCLRPSQNSNSGHDIHMEQPQLVIEAIREVVEAARNGRRQLAR